VFSPGAVRLGYDRRAHAIGQLGGKEEQKFLLSMLFLEHHRGTMRGAAAGVKRIEDRAERQARIERAAEHVFAYRGVNAATMDDIARQSGVSKGALYLHFESKEQLYLSLAVRSLQDLIQKLEATTATAGTGFERTAAIVDTYARYSLSEPARFCLAGAWIARDWQFPSGEPLAASYAELVKNALLISTESIELGKRDGSIRPNLDTQLTILQVVGGMHGVFAVRTKILESESQMPPQLDPYLWAGVIGQDGTGAPRVIDRERLVMSYVELILAAIKQP